MKRAAVIGIMFLAAGLSVQASDFSDKKMEVFFSSLKQEQFEEGITELLSGSVLEEKVIKVKQTMNNWINQFMQIRSVYGEYLAYERVFSQELGNLEETTYLVHCEEYPIRIVITEYDNGKGPRLVNMLFDDEVIEVLREYGRIVR